MMSGSPMQQMHLGCANKMAAMCGQLIACLLLRGCVESNPGPGEKKKNKRFNGNLHPIISTSSFQEQHDAAALQLQQQQQQQLNDEKESQSQRDQQLVQQRQLSVAAQEPKPGAVDGVPVVPSKSLTSEKTTNSGPSAIDGEFYEFKMLALLYLRSLNRVFGPEKTFKHFKIASNLKAAGAFDDIVLSTSNDQEEWKTTLIQLKHKSRFTIKYDALVSSRDRAPFSLIKYYQSFDNIQKSMGNGLSGQFADFNYVLYTNAQIDKFIQRDEIEDSVDVLLSTYKEGPQNDTTVSFENSNAKQLKEVSLNSPDPKRFAEFLSRLRLYKNQAHVNDLEGLIDKEIMDLFSQEPVGNGGGIEEERSLVSNVTKSLVERIKGLWEQEKVEWLTEESDVWRSVITQHLSAEKVSHFKKFESSLKCHDEKSIESFCQKIKTDENPLHIVVVGKGATTLVAGKTYMPLMTERNFIFMGSADLLQKIEMVRSVISKNVCDGLVVDCDESLDYSQSNRLSSMLLKMIEDNKLKKLVLVSHKYNSLSKHLSENICHVQRIPCDFGWNDLTEETQTLLLSRNVKFQGHNVLFSDIVSEDRALLTDELNCEMLVQLENGKLHIGPELAPLIGNYIDRTLLCKNERVYLKDIPKGVVVVIAPAGMGKSTLVTHIARKSKQEEKTTWVVRINLNDCTEYLQNLNVDSINDIVAVEFLTKFACANTDLEKEFFKYCLKVSGKLVVILDGFDEVCPYYEDKVVQILKLLRDTKISSIWITSRCLGEERLKDILGVSTYALQPFLKRDKIKFFKGFWQSKFGKDETALNQFVKKAIKLCNTLRDTNNKLITADIPQQTLMLAEYFDEQMKENRGQELRLPERINIAKLYDTFVQKMLKVYFEEKRKDDVTKVLVIAGKEIIEKDIKLNHMEAALMTLLSREDQLSINRNSVSEIKESQYPIIVKVGIIDKFQNGKPRFVHRCFAEYFMSLWISENYCENKSLRLFLRKNLFTKTFQTVRTFLDLQLGQNFDLHLAVLNESLERVTKLLRDGVDVNQVDSAGRTALHLSAASNLTQISTLLLSQGSCQVDVVDNLLEWRPLQYSDRVSSWSVAGSILRSGGCMEDMTSTISLSGEKVSGVFIEYLSNSSDLPDPCARHDMETQRAAEVGSGGAPILLEASRQGVVEIVKYLVEEWGVKIDCCQTEDGASPLHLSAEGGHVNVLKYVFSLNTSTHVYDARMNTPLHYAASYDQMSAMECLLGQGFEVDSRNVDRSTPLLLAARDGSIDSMKLLLDAGADVNANNNEGWTPLLFVSERDNDEAVEFLLTKKANVDAFNNERSSPLLFAAETGNIKILQLFLDSDANTDVKGMSNLTQLQKDLTLLIVTFKGDLDQALKLLKLGAQVNYRNSKSISALHWAAMHDDELTSLQFVELFVQHNADLNCVDKSGKSPLIYAIEKGHRRVVDCLIKNGADVATNETTAISPLKTATQCGDLHIVKLLLNILTSGSKEKLIQIINELELIFVAAQNGFLEVVKSFVSLGVDVSVTNKDNVPLSCIAAKHGKLDILMYLCDTSRTAFSQEVLNQAILEATQNGAFETANFLIKRGADLSIRDGRGYSLLRTAVEAGSCKIAEVLIQRKANLIDREIPILFAAIRNRNLELIKLLIDSGTDIEASDKNKSTALLVASEFSDLPIVKYLLEQKADPTTRNKAGESCILLASLSNDNLEVVRCLVDAGASLTDWNADHEQPVHWAAHSGNLRVLKYLVSKGANANVKSSLHDTPLFKASMNGKLEVVKYLVEETGSDLTLKNATGHGVLHMAAIGGNLSVVKYLINQGANTKLLDDEKDTPFHCSVKNGGLDLAKYMVDVGFEVNDKNARGESVVHLFSKIGKLDVLKYLVEKEADVHATTVPELNPPLFYACDGGKVEVVRYFLENGVSFDVRNSVQDSALHRSAGAGDLESVKLLLSKGIDVNITNQDNATPLLFASTTGNVQVVEFLVDNGADITAESNSQNTALHLAARYRKLEIVKFLVEKGADQLARNNNKNRPVDIARDVKVREFLNAALHL